MIKKLILLLLVVCGGVSANATDYYIASNTVNNGSEWTNQGQMTDEDGDGTYTFIMNIHVKVWVENGDPYFDQQFFTICTSSSFSWENVYRPVSDGNYVITNNENGNVVTMNTNPNANNNVITYPNSWQDSQYKNYASAIKIDFTPSENRLVVTRLISIVSEHNSWSQTTDYLTETSNGSKIYTGKVSVSTSGFKFYLHQDGWDYYGRNGGSGYIVNTVGDNVTVSKDGLYEFTANLNTFNWIDPTLVTVSATMKYPYATFSSDYALDFTGVTEIKAYQAEMDGTRVKMTRVSGKVPANTGLFVASASGEDGATANIPTTICTTELTGNLLKATTGAPVESENLYSFVKRGDDYGFAKVPSGYTWAKGKAYLETSGTVYAPSLGFTMDDDETTTIHSIELGVVNNENGVMYNLAGQRISKPTTGVYIMNGKKVIVK